MEHIEYVYAQFIKIPFFLKNIDVKISLSLENKDCMIYRCERCPGDTILSERCPGDNR